MVRSADVPPGPLLFATGPAGEPTSGLRVLAAASPRGLARVALGFSDAEMLAVVRAEAAAAGTEIGPDRDGVLDPVLQVLDALARGCAPDLAESVTLDVAGTPFQRAVWEALAAIPAGETRSYAEIARAVGRPEAVRAVGAACGANPVALVVPCHRVVRSDGSLGGYRWGLDVKARLLAAEAAQGTVRPTTVRPALARIA